VDHATAARLLTEARVGRLATVRADGRPHMVPCCFVYTGDAVYSAVDDVKPKFSPALRRLDNLRANPAATLLVDHYSDDWAQLWWIRVDGDARIVDDVVERERAIAQLCLKYEQYARRPPPGPVLAIDVTGWRAWP
jgi:PPOX class probable F420-dependent enzyme